MRKSTIEQGGGLVKKRSNRLVEEEDLAWPKREAGVAVAGHARVIFEPSQPKEPVTAVPQSIVSLPKPHYSEDREAAADTAIRRRSGIAPDQH